MGKDSYARGIVFRHLPLRGSGSESTKLNNSFLGRATRERTERIPARVNRGDPNPDNPRRDDYVVNCIVIEHLERDRSISKSERDKPTIARERSRSLIGKCKETRAGAISIRLGGFASIFFPFTGK